ncbi:HipA family kinase [Tunturiibacter gelidoferens]|uniref:HipA-like kinase domain-containing protein n=1 Tax=Tunturiibacter gelidiferens TaxID=3069689 RepID=A0AAU7YZS7_9BACT
MYASEVPFGGKVGLVEFCSFEDSLHPCSNAILSANKYIRKMKGGSQSILVRANDGRHYVVKMTDNPIGPNLLANEHMGSLVAKAVGLPVAEARGICLSDSFIDSHPDLWFELPSGVRRPDKGMHFGSLFVGQTSGPDRPTEYISPSRVSMITNREVFLGMYLLDVWANHQDNRQAIFRRSSTNAQEVCFIDHGHMFGGPEWNFEGNLGSALHLEMAVYTDLWHDKQVASWISRFQTIIPEVLTSIVPPMASEWYKGDLSELHSSLTDRLLRLPELVQADAEKTWHPSQQKIIDESLRLSDLGIHDLRTPDTRSAFRRGRATA